MSSGASIICGRGKFPWLGRDFVIEKSHRCSAQAASTHAADNKTARVRWYTMGKELEKHMFLGDIMSTKTSVQHESVLGGSVIRRVLGCTRLDSVVVLRSITSDMALLKSIAVPTAMASRSAWSLWKIRKAS